MKTISKIEGFQDRYDVTSDGEIYCNKKLMHPCDNGLGYKVIRLYDLNNERKMWYVHRLVYTVFMGEIKNEINHKDHNKSNNKLENLEDISRKENIDKAIEFHGGAFRDKTKPLKIKPICSMCGVEISEYAKICKSCYTIKAKKVSRPSYQKLVQQIIDLGYCGTARLYGVSDNAIRKWVKTMEKNPK